MVTNKKFFKWDVDADYPYPFNDFKERRISVDAYEDDGSIKKVSSCIIRGLLKASVALVNAEAGLIPTSGTNHIQIGMSSDGKGNEEIFVEYEDLLNPDLIECVAYNPGTGSIKGCIYNLSLALAKPYKFDGTAKDYIPDCTAVWAALLVSARSDASMPRVKASFDGLENLIHRAFSASTPISNDEIAKSIGELSFEMYRHLAKTGRIKLNIKDEDNQLKTIKKLELECGDIGPSMGKKLYPWEYKVFKDVRNPKKRDASCTDMSRYKDYPFEKSLASYSLAEQMLVPSGDSSFTPSEDFIKVMDYFYDSRNDGKDQIKQIMLLGGPGGGKSTIGVMAGRYLGGGRPTITFTCGSNYTSDELKGMLLPVPGGEISGLTGPETALLDAIRNSSTEDMLETCANALGYPGILDCTFDPEGAYRKLTGDEMPKEMMDSDVIKLMTGLVMNAVKSLSSKVKSKTDNITYKYMPSGIVEAMTKGYFLVLDELTNLRDPAALSDLHEAFDTASPTRRIATATGDLFVHPDFRCITTANIGLEGNKRINQATLNRLGQVVLSIDDLSKDQMIARAKNRTGIDDAKLLSNCFDVYERLKLAAEELRTPGIISPRDFFIFAKAISRGDEPRDVVRELFIYKLTQGASKEDEAELMEVIDDLALMQA